jgi:hypothetical protein
MQSPFAPMERHRQSSHAPPRRLEDTMTSEQKIADQSRHPNSARFEFNHRWMSETA